MHSSNNLKRMGPYGLVHMRKEVVHHLSVELEGDELEATLIRPLLLHFCCATFKVFCGALLFSAFSDMICAVNNQLALPCMVHK